MTLSDEQGSIHISEEVIAAIAVGAVREVEGVSGMMGNLRYSAGAPVPPDLWPPDSA